MGTDLAGSAPFANTRIIFRLSSVRMCTSMDPNGTEKKHTLRLSARSCGVVEGRKVPPALVVSQCPSPLPGGSNAVLTAVSTTVTGIVSDPGGAGGCSWAGGGWGRGWDQPSAPDPNLRARLRGPTWRPSPLYRLYSWHRGE